MLNDYTNNYKIILASGSPRRHQFFRDMGFDFTVQVKEIDEIYPTHLIAEQIPEYLAKLKASAFDSLAPNEILITSDTIVWHQNEALGKPDNITHAKEMIASLSGKTHEVITAVCFKTKVQTKVISHATKVTFNKLRNEDIDYYVDTFKPLDKAGSYGIQEWIGTIGISHIEGSFTNVVGLPTHQVYEILNELMD